MNRQLDVLFVNADSSAQAYQELSKVYSAIEPPTWALLLAQSCRAKGYGVAILDADAERLTLQQSVQRIAEAKPRLVCFVVYGQNPNSGTTSMIASPAVITPPTVWTVDWNTVPSCGARMMGTPNVFTNSCAASMSSRERARKQT